MSLANVDARFLFCCLIAALLGPAGCSRETRNTFKDALAKSTEGGYVVIEQERSENSGYAILGDSIPPKSKVAYVLVALCQAPLDPDPKTLWASVITLEFGLDNGTLSSTGMRFDRAVRTTTPIQDISHKWEPKWEKYLQTAGVSLADTDKPRVKAMQQYLFDQLSGRPKSGR